MFDKERIIDLLNKKGIALYDTASAVRRLQDNASDKFLEVVEQTDISLLLKQIPMCKAIVTTGQKATDIIREQIKVKEPVVGTSEPFEFEDRIMRLYRMPSSSRAYPLPIENVSNHFFRISTRTRLQKIMTSRQIQISRNILPHINHFHLIYTI